MTRFGLTHLCWEWRKMILQTGVVYADAENEDIRFEGKFLVDPYKNNDRPS
jgi:hypothetical protein